MQSVLAPTRWRTERVPPSMVGVWAAIRSARTERRGTPTPTIYRSARGIDCRRSERHPNGSGRVARGGDGEDPPRDMGNPVSVGMAADGARRPRTKDGGRTKNRSTSVPRILHESPNCRPNVGPWNSHDPGRGGFPPATDKQGTKHQRGAHRTAPRRRTR